jgi:hypothetical protein
MTQTQITLTDQQTALIIGALRKMQDPVNADILDIITNGGEYGLPSDQDIDQLCEALNFAESNTAAPIRVCVTVEGGVVQNVFSDQATIAPLIIDYDTDGADPEELSQVSQGNGATVAAWVLEYNDETPMAWPVYSKPTVLEG